MPKRRIDQKQHLNIGPLHHDVGRCFNASVTRCVEEFHPAQTVLRGFFAAADAPLLFLRPAIAILP
jgi:hypothetical protein